VFLIKWAVKIHKEGKKKSQENIKDKVDTKDMNEGDKKN
jgi:hypothetical protein